MYSHTTTILLVTLAARLIALGVGVATIRKLHALEVNPPLACALGFIASMATGVTGTFGTKMMERRNEITADYTSATHLNAKAGGIAFLKTAERYNLYDYSKLLNRLLEAHPSPAERIALLENITNQNS
jgi:Zn-dependent protease with chaperone function